MWTLYPPVPNKTPYFSVRGVYCGIRLDKKSTGASEERAAKRILATWKAAAERGEFLQAPAQEVLTLAKAAKAYVDAGFEDRFLDRIVAKYGTTPIADITQAVIDVWAREVYPDNPAATVNRQFYTPISAVLKRAGQDIEVRRPKGCRPQSAPFWFKPEQAFAVLDAAYAQDHEFGIFCELALYTGCRLSELLGIEIGQIDLGNSVIRLPVTKNGKPRTVHLTPGCVAALAGHPRGLQRGAGDRLFRFYKGGEFTYRLHRAIEQAGLSEAFPDARHRGFHLFRHTWATWQALYNGLTAYELARTGVWSDPRSADRYNHVAVSHEARKADNLPVREVKHG